MAQPLDLKGLQCLLWNFAGHRTVTTAAKCGILSRLARTPGTVTEVSGDLDLAFEACDKVMRALVALGVLERDDAIFRMVPDLKPLFVEGHGNRAPKDVIPSPHFRSNESDNRVALLFKGINQSLTDKPRRSRNYDSHFIDPNIRLHLTQTNCRRGVNSAANQHHFESWQCPTCRQNRRR